MRALVIGLLVVAGCSAARQPAALAGSYRFMSLNAAALPVEFPAGSGQRLESGLLELRADQRYVMRFGMRAPGTELANYGNDGTWRIVADTVYFTPDPRATQPPVVFRFEHVARGLRLVDTTGNVWVYERR